MKTRLIIIGLLVISCTPTSTIKNTTDKPKDEKIEGAVVSKKTPMKVSGFNFVEKHNAYFREDLTESLVGRIMKKLDNGETPSDKSSRFSQQVKPLTSQFKYPFWSDYFGDKIISGTIQLNILVSKYGKPEVIIVEHGIDEEVDRITVDHVKNFPFAPAIHKRSGNPTRAWIKIRNTF